MPPLVVSLLALLLGGGGATPQKGPSPLLDLAGRRVDPFQEARSKLVVLVFVRTDCPLSNRYAPEVQRLHARFARRGAAFWLVYPDPAEPPEAIRRHLREYGYQIDALRDPDHALAERSKVRVTPEAAVFAPGGRLLYHGRIDDRYLDFGKARASATTHDLEAALDAGLEGRPPAPASAPAVGCSIADLK